ncbi:uncharacterized protein LOC143023041 [Oratosquilla oratoria]|uniref:uncharacterized protein LOC143023041 n=1 Tax=Oratosquilla oratoria TaxID=337810 RepID=UPI003F75D892
MCNTRHITGTPASESSGRVPPLPSNADLLLSKAVEALVLWAPTAPHQCARRLPVCQKQNEKVTGSSTSAASNTSNSIPPPSANSDPKIASSHQCGACGVQFSSVEVLMQHLSKHVYEGLYAAQWLVQALQLLPPNVSGLQDSSAPSQRQ